MDITNKHILTPAKEKISFLYIEKARIEQTEYGIQVIQGRNYSEIPIATIACLLLGPGVSITHRAVENIASAGCSICWMGEYGTKFYCYGEPMTSHSKNILMQMKYHESTALRMKIVRRMYQIRYPNAHIKSKKIEELRGYEGQHVKECYQRLSEEYNIPWQGRVYHTDDFSQSDDINKNLTMLNQYLYAIIEAILVTMGFSTAIGFIHTGNIHSFVFDIADLYKETVLFPLAFRITANDGYNLAKLRKEFHKTVQEHHLMKQIINDLKKLFIDAEEVCQIPEIEGELWNYKSFVKSGINYANKPEIKN